MNSFNNINTVVEYIWIGGNQELRSKTRILYDLGTNDINEIPEWNFDGSSTDQSSGEESELILKPKKLFMNPFRPSKKTNKNSIFVLVLCDVYYPDGTPHKTNTRVLADEIFNQGPGEEPWFGIEQEYFLIDDDDYNFLMESSYQGPYYCGNGNVNAYYRDIVETHMNMCIAAGVKIGGVNAEVAPCQWEYQIGPLEGIKVSDHLIVSRWIMERVSEMFNVTVCWHPKPFQNLNGSGAHTNFSTKKMREDNGLTHIKEAIAKLKDNHISHMFLYGKNNDKRMTGNHETSSYNEFKFDINKPFNRGCSVRIGSDTINKKCGYFEDRRPAANMDPYLVTSKIFKTTCLD